MTHWLYPANTKFYDVLGAFREVETTYWPVNSKVSVGDVIYMYLAAPHKQIAFMCDVREVNLEEKSVLEHIRPFFKDEIDEKKQSKLFMKLQVSSAIALESDSLLNYHSLKEHGLHGMLMGSRKLENNPTLLDYIKRSV